MLTSADLRFYYPHFDGTADGDANTLLTVDGTPDSGTFEADDLTGAADAYNGATVRWLTGGNANTVSHVKSWAGTATNIWIVARTPSGTITAGDTFEVYDMDAGSQYRSSREIPGLPSTDVGTAAGEVNENGTFANIIYSSYKNGTGAGTLSYHEANEDMHWYAPDGTAVGAAIEVGADGTYVLYGANEDKYIQVAIDWDVKSTSDSLSVVTLSCTPQQVIPNFEGYQAGTLTARYFLIPCKNNNVTDAMHESKVYTLPVSGSAFTTTIDSGTLGSAAGSLTLADAANFPARNFWIYNVDGTAARYCQYKNGDDIYLVARGADDMLRGFAGTNDWSGTQTLRLMSDIDIALAPAVADEYPGDLTALTYSAPITYADGLSLGEIAAEAIDGIAIREVIPEDMYPQDDIVSKVFIRGW